MVLRCWLSPADPERRFRDDLSMSGGQRLRFFQMHDPPISLLSRCCFAAVDVVVLDCLAVLAGIWYVRRSSGDFVFG